MWIWIVDVDVVGGTTDGIDLAINGLYFFSLFLVFGEVLIYVCALVTIENPSNLKLATGDLSAFAFISPSLPL